MGRPVPAGGQHRAAQGLKSCNGLAAGGHARLQLLHWLFSGGRSGDSRHRQACIMTGQACYCHWQLTWCCSCQANKGAPPCHRRRPAAGSGSCLSGVATTAQACRASRGGTAGKPWNVHARQAWEAACLVLPQRPRHGKQAGAGPRAGPGECRPVEGLCGRLRRTCPQAPPGCA